MLGLGLMSDMRRILFALSNRNNVYFRPVRPSQCEADAGIPPADISGRLRSGNVCLLRSALSSMRCQNLREVAERRMATSDGGLHAVVFGNGSRDGAIDIDVSIILHVLASPCLDVARHYFRVEPIVQMANFLVRRFDPTDRRIDDLLVPYHQDGFGYGGLDVLNCWTLLSPDECGETSPGLEFVLDRFDSVIEIEKNPEPSAYSHQVPSLRRMADYLDAYDPWRPSVRLGDVLIFNELSMHRSYLHSSQHRSRYSAELRLMPHDAATLAYHKHFGQPFYTISGRTLAGPSRIRQKTDGAIEVLANGEWQIA